MLKIKKVKFNQHPILGDAEFDFCDESGRAANMVIIAGENGVGKSKLIEALYNFASKESNGSSFTVNYEIDSIDRQTVVQGSYWGGWSTVDIATSQRLSGDALNKLCAIFSEVGINYRSSSDIRSVTSLSLDSSPGSYRTSSNLAGEIKQLLVDVQALDDQESSRVYREAKAQGKDLNLVKIDSRMERFSRAFSHMFTDLKYDRIENSNNHKVVMFKKNGVDVPLDDLSSGEKQIVFRGCFLLRNKGATKGAVVFIDEPEISLHPEWQKKILGFYRKIFTDTEGNLSSQIFVVTHSPFIIHGEDRENDKVIVLQRDSDGKIEVVSRPEYYTIGPQEAIRDAFKVEHVDISESCIFVEGRTDEKYLNRALAVYGIDAPFKFKWIGYIDNNGQERNTGSSALERGFEFILAHKESEKEYGFLYDCDTKKPALDTDNIHIRTFPKYESVKKIKRGIENALLLDNIDLSSYYVEKITEGEYGEQKTIQEFQKMRLCEDICQKGDEELTTIFTNFKVIIDEFMGLFSR